MRTKRLNLFVAFLGGLTLLAAGCGSSEGTLPPFGQTGFDFQVMWSIPDYDSEWNVEVREIEVGLNEPIDQASVPANVRVMEYQGSTGTDITDKGILSFRNNGSVLVYTPNPGRTFRSNSHYQMVLTSGLLSQAGRSLVALTNVIFSTGARNNNGLGTISVDGPPKVVNWNLYSFAPPYCLVAFVEFNEDISGVPRASYTARLIDRNIIPNFLDFLDDMGTFSRNLMQAVPAFSNSNRAFFLEFMDYTCTNEWRTISTEVSVTVNDVFDLDGERMSGSASKDFNPGLTLF